jgi:hypothetical protein
LNIREAAGFKTARLLYGEVDLDVRVRGPRKSSTAEAAGMPASSSGAPPAVGLPPVPLVEDRFFGGNQQWPVPGGFIVYNVRGDSLDAHCSCNRHDDRHNPCRLNRTRSVCKRGINKARGRPLGYLMAWLAAAHLKGSAAEHKDMTKPRLQTPVDLESFSLARREAGRQWIVDRGYTDLLEIERKKLDSEPAEPVDLV